MERQGIDKLNSLRSIPYEEYFGEMPISDEEKDKRIKMAELIDDVFFQLFLLINSYIELHKDLDYALFEDFTLRRFEDVIDISDLSDLELYPDIPTYIATATSEVIETTKKNIGTPWYLSEDRAKLIAENESNSLYEYAGLQIAISEGKTRKTWVTMMDKFVRHTHRIVDSETIGIKDAFEVGQYLMMQPKDTSLGAGMEEIANCRCTCIYT